MKAAVFLAKGFEEIEAVGVIDVLRRGGIETTIVSVAGNEQVEGAHGIIVRADQIFYQVDYNHYDLLILPGGMPGIENLANHEDLCDLLIDFNKKGKWIAAICAAPSVLGYLGLLEGERAVCYPGFEKYLSGATISTNDVVVSNHIITAKGAGVVFEFGLVILEQFIEKEKVEKLRKGMIVSTG